VSLLRTTGRRGQGGGRITLAVDPHKVFRDQIWRFYRVHGRDLPWRHTCDPYRVLVSEVMLQQTGADRVKSRYELFLARFPDFPTLAKAPPREVLAAWQGLGYNRRALALKSLAERVTDDFGGCLPDDERQLRALPGVGPYTAAAVLVFSFNQPVVMIETNIRRVFIHCFFQDRTGIDDSEIRPLVRDTLDRKNPRGWYNALMDYGASLSTLPGNPNQRSRHYQRQAPFEGSARQKRGRVLKAVLAAGQLTGADLCGELNVSPSELDTILSRLEQEGFIERTGGLVRIRSGDRS
jgi:A/G-specific adenine glycosylase